MLSCYFGCSGELQGLSCGTGTAGKSAGKVANMQGPVLLLLLHPCCGLQGYLASES